MDEQPDIIVSGINDGANLASNVIYSGTVSAATEGGMFGIRSIAVSLASKEFSDFSASAEVGAYFADYLYKSDLPDYTILNINVPPVSKSEIKGWRFAKQGKSRFLDKFVKRTHPRGGEYYWLAGEKNEIDITKDSDEYLVDNNYVSVTPLMFDMTDHQMYNDLKKREGNGEFI